MHQRSARSAKAGSQPIGSLISRLQRIASLVHRHFPAAKCEAAVSRRERRRRLTARETRRVTAAIEPRTSDGPLARGQKQISHWLTSFALAQGMPPPQYSGIPSWALPPEINLACRIAARAASPPAFPPHRSCRGRGRRPHREASGEAFGLGADGVEIDKPALEQCPYYRLQRLRSSAGSTRSCRPVHQSR